MALGSKSRCQLVRDIQHLIKYIKYKLRTNVWMPDLKITMAIVPFMTAANTQKIVRHI